MGNSGDQVIYDPKKTLGAAVARTTFDLVVESAILVAEGYVPILATTPLKQVFEFCVRKFMALIYVESENATSMLVIDIKVNRESKEYKEAVSSLETAISHKTKEEIEVERQKFKEKLRSLISLKP